MRSIRRLYEIVRVVLWGPPLTVLGLLAAGAVAVMLVRAHERLQLPEKAEAAGRAQGYAVVTFERVVRKGRHWAVACGAADGHRAVYASDHILRVEDRDPIAASRYEHYCDGGREPARDW